MATAAENWLLWLRGARVHRRNCVRDCGVYTAPNTEREHSDRRGALRDEITVPIPSSRICRFNNQPLEHTLVRRDWLANLLPRRGSLLAQTTELRSCLARLYSPRRSATKHRTDPALSRQEQQCSPGRHPPVPA